MIKKLIAVSVVLAAVIFLTVSVDAASLKGYKFPGKGGSRESKPSVSPSASALPSFSPKALPTVTKGENRNERALCQVKAKDDYLKALKAADKDKKAQKVVKEAFKAAKEACKK